MSIWQAPYRPPPLRSKAVVRPHRSAVDGDVSGAALQPISPPDLIPLKRGFWATYGKQVAACGLGLLASIFFAWGSLVFAQEKEADELEFKRGINIVILPRPNDYWTAGEWLEAAEERGWDRIIYLYHPLEADEEETANVYLYLAILIAGVMLFIPLFLFWRWRRMEKIFGEEMYDSDEGVPEKGPEPEEELTPEERYHLRPNPDQVLDNSQVLVAVLLLGLTAAVQGVMGGLLVSGELKVEHLMPLEVWLIFGFVLLGLSLLNLACIVSVLRHNVGASRLAFYGAVAGVGMAVLTVHWAAITAALTSAVLIWALDRAFRRMLDRVAQPEKADPLQAYYHNLLQLLVWVMRADGHADRRELQKIRDTCDDMNLSTWERDVVIESANLDDRKSLRQAVKRYLEAADAAGLDDPGGSLLVVAMAVAGADGVVTAEEADAIRELARPLSVTDEHVNQLLLQQQLHLEALDLPRAHELLQLDDGATRAEIEAAHATLGGELAEARYAHLGHALASQLAKRHEMLDRARDLLLSEARA